MKSSPLGPDMLCGFVRRCSRPRGVWRRRHGALGGRGGRLLNNTECNNPLVCAFKRCHAECTTSRDCKIPGQLCVQERIAETGQLLGTVCQLPDETKCTMNSQCKEPLISGIDGHCREQCALDRDCIIGQPARRTRASIRRSTGASRTTACSRRCWRAVSFRGRSGPPAGRRRHDRNGRRGRKRGGRGRRFQRRRPGRRRRRRRRGRRNDGRRGGNRGQRRNRRNEWRRWSSGQRSRRFARRQARRGRLRSSLHARRSVRAHQRPVPQRLDLFLRNDAPHVLADRHPGRRRHAVRREQTASPACAKRPRRSSP